MFQLQRYLYLHFWNRNLSVDLEFSDDKAVEGDEIELIETVANQKLLPLPILKLKFTASRYFSFLDTQSTEVTDNYYRNDIVSVMMYQKLTRKLPFLCTHRGYFTINEIFLVCHDIFISAKTMSTLNSDIHLYVYPSPVEYNKLNIPFQKMLGTIITKRCLNEDPFEFRSIREYQSYDTLKTINWKASAKTGSLKVNVHDYTSSQQVIILLNLESETIWRYEDLEEESIRIAASLATAFIEQGIPTALYTNAINPATGNSFRVPVGSSIHHIRTINETLARIDTSLPMPAFVTTVLKDSNDATFNDYVVVISTYQKEDLQMHLSNYITDKIDFSWIVPINKEVNLTVSKELVPYIVPWEI